MRIIFLCLFLVLCGVAQARPVYYPGGWTFITAHDGEENSGLLNYTVTPKLAFGYRASYDRDTDAMFNGIQMNNLLQRWNNPDSQANIYLQSAVGLAQGDVEGFTGVQADWESRRYMVVYENRVSFLKNEIRRDYQQQLELGVAPYVAEFGALHTWAMLHIINMPEENHAIQFAPMLRMFKGNALIEAGYNVTTDRPVANATIRF